MEMYLLNLVDMGADLVVTQLNRSELAHSGGMHADPYANQIIGAYSDKRRCPSLQIECSAAVTTTEGGEGSRNYLGLRSIRAHVLWKRSGSSCSVFKLSYLRLALKTTHGFVIGIYNASIILPQIHDPCISL